jgi:hypothetical protein
MHGFLYWSAYNKICETVHMDAAPGRLLNGDTNGCGNSLAKASRDAKATPELFVLATRQFLSTADALSCTLAVPGYDEWTCGFKTKRVGDYLYVTEAAQETRLAPGMRIAAVGKNAVPFLLRDLGQEIFWGRGTDREDWDLVLRMYDSIDVFPGDGHVERLDLRAYPVQDAAEKPALSFERIGDALVARVGSLADADALEASLEQARAEGAFTGAQKLVLDLRGCAGDADPAAWLALLPYLVDAPVAAREVFGDEEVWSIYSKANADLLGGLLERAKTAVASDPEALAQVDGLIADVRAKEARVLEAKRAVRGMRARKEASELKEVVPSPFANERIEPAADAPARVAILVDETLGFGAERLAQAAMGMEKVALVGRATQGLVDYRNFVTLDLYEIGAYFTYPMSRTAANHDGAGYARSGLPLDAHVPFTPEECGRDLVLEAALQA